MLSNLTEKKASENTNLGRKEQSNPSAQPDSEPQASSRGAQAARGVWEVLEGIGTDASGGVTGARPAAPASTDAQGAPKPSEAASRRTNPGSAGVDG